MRILLIDSFKEEYLKYMPYLKSLTKLYQYGKLETPLGFWSSMELFFKGKTNTLAFFYYSEKSSLKWTKYFKFLGKYILNLLINLQRLLKGEQLFLIHNIPLNRLYLFDTIAKKPFHKGLGIKYTIISRLDKLAHYYGTKSIEVKKYLLKLDKKLRKIKFDVFLSDHGMIDVKEIVSVPETKIGFIDSTMARYWFDTPKLPLNKGKLIKADKKFGHTIFLANPGVLILPNYWQGSKPVKAMHGYNPKNEDMKSFYLIKKEGKRKDLHIKDLRKIVFNNSPRYVHK